VECRVTESVHGPQVEVQSRQERADKLETTKHAGEVHGIETQLVGPQTDQSASFQQRTRQSDAPSLVGDQRTAHERRSTVGGAVASVHVGAELGKHLDLRHIERFPIRISLFYYDTTYSLCTYNHRPSINTV